MAAVRAATMQRRMPAADRSQPAGPAESSGSMPRRAASRAAVTANGSAKMVWLKRTSSKYVRRRDGGRSAAVVAPSPVVAVAIRRRLPSGG